MNKYIFFVFSNRALLPALGMFEHFRQYDVIEFVVPFESLAEFIKGLQIPRSKVILADSRLSTVKNLREIVRHKRELDAIYRDHLKDKVGYHVYFFERCFEVSLLYLIQRMSRNNQISYYEYHANDLAKLKELKTAKYVMRRLMYALLYSLNIRYHELDESDAFPRVQNDYFKNNGIQIVDKNINFEDVSTLCKYAAKEKNCERAKVLFLYTDYVKDGVIAEEEFVKMHRTLFGILDRYFSPEQIVYKAHPTFGGNLGPIEFIRKYRSLDSKTPAEFLFYSGNITSIIAIGSIALKSAVKYGNFAVVAMFNLAAFKDPEQKRIIRDNYALDDAIPAGKLLVPETWKEFEGIISNVARSTVDSQHIL